jgi:hypothetical protein
VKPIRHLFMTGASLVAALAVSDAQAPRMPNVQLLRATPLTLPGVADSNSPAVWDLVDGLPTLHVLTSVNGEPRLAVGGRLATLASAAPVAFSVRPPHGVWMESVIPDVDGTWYGYYHNEIPADDLCGDPDRVVPRIGAARSTDYGATWEDLGVILEAPRGSHVCESENFYFVGGVGDFTAVLDADARDVYFFYSQYVGREWGQGVAVARLAWADRDDPVGRIATWTRGVWLPARVFPAPDGDETERMFYPAGTPIYRAAESWHVEGPSVDAFWGPSVHWNTHLEQYVMLLNRARDMHWAQEGIYIAFSPTLEDPSQWSAPQKLLDGGGWYPQVIGLEPGSGTDRTAGAVARLFVAGRSDYLIQFSR